MRTNALFMFVMVRRVFLNINVLKKEEEEEE